MGRFRVYRRQLLLTFGLLLAQLAGWAQTPASPEQSALPTSLQKFFAAYPAASLTPEQRDLVNRLLRSFREAQRLQEREVANYSQEKEANFWGLFNNYDDSLKSEYDASLAYVGGLAKDLVEQLSYTQVFTLHTLLQEELRTPIYRSRNNPYTSSDLLLPIATTVTRRLLAWNNPEDNLEAALLLAEVLQSGPRFRLMSRMAGEHFLELPETTASQKQRKRRLAMAIVTLELNNILTGKPFDNDRHGGNVRVDGVNIGHYDLGSVEVEPAAAGAYTQLANIMIDALLKSSSATSFGEAMLAQIRALREAGQEVDPLITRVQKALLSLGEYVRLLSGEDIKRVLYSACTQGSIHPEIRGAVLARLGMAVIFRPAETIANFFRRHGVQTNVEMTMAPSDIITITRP